MKAQATHSCEDRSTAISVTDYQGKLCVVPSAARAWHGASCGQIEGRVMCTLGRSRPSFPADID